MDIEEGSNDSESHSEEEYDQDVSKSVKYVSSCCRWARDTLEKYTKLVSYVTHTTLLLNKNITLASRNKSQIVYLACVPIFLLCLVRFFQTIADDFTSYKVLDHPTHDLDNIEECFHSSGECLTIGYGIIGDVKDKSGKYNWIHNSMKHLAETNNLKYGEDVKLISQGSSLDFRAYLDQNVNKTLFGVLFCTTDWSTKVDISNTTLSEYSEFEEVGLSIPCTSGLPDKQMYMYSIVYNYSLIPYDLETIADAYRWNSLTTIKTSIDNGILRELHKQETGSYKGSPEIKNSESKYPSLPDRVHDGFDASAVFGSLYFFVPSLTIFSTIFGLLLREKVLKLRVGLHVFGLSSASHWTAWIITAIAYSCIPAIIFPFIGHYLGMGVFANCPYLMTFIIFFLASFCMTTVAFFGSTVVGDETAGYVFSFVIILFSVLLLIILHNPVTSYFLFFNTKSPFWVFYVRELFQCIPAFNFVLLYGQIARIACNHFDGGSLMQIAARKVTWGDLFIKPTGSFVMGDKYLVPCPMDLINRILFNMLVFLILTWYFDHIMPNNRGRTHSYFFFLKPSYWLGRKKQVVEDNFPNRRRRLSSVEKYDLNRGPGKNSYNEEKRQIQIDEQNDVECEGLRINGLTKVYRKYPFGCKSTSDLRALKGVYFEARDGELLSILGHNGAGKTTLINILTGQLNASGGDARIGNLKISKDMEIIRKDLGVVPQFDILWDMMTVEEHLRLFCHLKEIPEEMINNTIKSTLAEVGLSNQADNEVRTLSGGMKRRLSIAISGLGNPNVIIMDEPTTGLDPVSRRKVWELIQKLKKDRVVILTTHSMEEADILSDKIAIIAGGRIKCIGTQLSLKHQYGEGYTVSINCDLENTDLVQKKISEYIPFCTLKEQNGGSLKFSIPSEKITSSRAFFSLLQEGSIPKISTEPDDDCPEVVPSPHEISTIEDIKPFVQDCGISHTTLEEVFLRVTKGAS